MVQDHSGGNLIHRFCFSRKHNYTGNHLSGVQITLVLSVHCFRSIITWSWFFFFVFFLKRFCTIGLLQRHTLGDVRCGSVKLLGQISLQHNERVWWLTRAVPIWRQAVLNMFCNFNHYVDWLHFLSSANETFATGTAIPVASYSYQGKGLYIIRQDIQQYSPSEIRNML